MFDFFRAMIRIVGGVIVSLGMLLGGGSVVDAPDEMPVVEIQESIVTEKILIDDSIVKESDVLGVDTKPDQVNIVELKTPTSPIAISPTPPTPPTPTISQPGDFQAECELSKDKVELGGLAKAILYVSSMEDSEYDVDWNEKYLRNREGHDEAYFIISSTEAKNNIFAKITRKLDGYSETVVCPLTVIPKENKLCQEAKEKTVDLARQKEDALAEYKVSLEKIKRNERGVFGGVLVGEISELNARYSDRESSLNAQLTTTNYQVRLYCE